MARTVGCLPSVHLKCPKPALKPTPKASPLDSFLATPLQRYFPPSVPWHHPVLRLLTQSCDFSNLSFDVFLLSPLRGLSPAPPLLLSSAFLEKSPLLWLFLVYLSCILQSEEHTTTATSVTSQPSSNPFHIPGGEVWIPLRVRDVRTAVCARLPASPRLMWGDTVANGFSLAWLLHLRCFLSWKTKPTW